VTGFKIHIAAFLCLFTLVSEAQYPDVSNLSARQLKKFALNAERAGDSYTAIFFYEQYREIREMNQYVNYRLAELSRDTRNYKKAKDMYEIVVARAGRKYPRARFYYARMLKATGEYALAIEEFKEFKRNYRFEKDYKTYSKLTRNDIEGCEKALKLLQEELKITIDQLSSSVNGPHIEFSPLPINDTTLYYGSLKLDSVVYFNENNIDTLMPYRKFYMATKEGLDWIGGKKFPLPFNKEGVHNGNGTFSKDGKRFYFTRCEPNWQNEMVCAIYQSTRENGKWSTPVKLPEVINDPSYTSTQPTVGRTAKYDREVLYFMSNRPDGRGGLDLWYSVYNPRREEWKEAKNMGFKINTPGDEMTPYYDNASRTLYFSSDGQPGIGGLDIFQTIGERRIWTDVENVGYPLNSSYDELYFTVGPSRDYGFFASNRPGRFYINNETCCDDIYYYKWKDFIRLSVTGKVYPMEKDRFGRQKDYSGFDFMNPPDTMSALEGAIIALYMNDPSSDEMIFMERDTTQEDGKYYFDLLPDREYQFFMEGFQYFNEEVHLSTQDINFSYQIEMPPIWVNVLMDKPIVLKDIHYEFNSAELTQSSKEVIDTTIMVLLEEAPEFIVEVGSHTDSVGKAQYNQKLSQERAENVVKYGIVERQFLAALKQIGTLGGGNHFIEIQKGSDGKVWIMIHSGSRNIGLRVAEHYNKVAKRFNEMWFTSVDSKKDLAFLPIETSEAKDYMNEMQYCVDFAFANRKLMMDNILMTFKTIIGKSFEAEDLINIAHNYARLENHFGTNVLVHRKGATSAREGETGIIPGSQGTKSYIVKGKGNAESFQSCSHGAGRKMGRKQAIRELSLEAEAKALDEKGVIHAIRNERDLDEAPGAYKNIDIVMENQKDLVDIEVELTPMAVIKG